MSATIEGWLADSDDKGRWFVLAKTTARAEDVAAICATNGYGESEARLIAAAPDLLAALLDCVAVMERDLDGLKVIQPELQQARAAIAKANGSAA